MSQARKRPRTLSPPKASSSASSDTPSAEPKYPSSEIFPLGLPPQEYERFEEDIVLQRRDGSPSVLSLRPAGAHLACERMVILSLAAILEFPKNRSFPISVEDWTWKQPHAVQKLRQLAHSNFHIVVYYCQLGLAKLRGATDIMAAVINLIANECGFGFHFYMAMESNEYRKPEIGLLQLLKEDGFGSDGLRCYVGDEAGRHDSWKKGRKKDSSSVDRKFALNIGASFYTPEEVFFGEKATDKFTMGGFDPSPFALTSTTTTTTRQTRILLEGDCQRLVMFVGPPASGKSSLYKCFFEPDGYVHVNQDELKTNAKCVSAVTAALAKGKSVVLDNTNPSKKARKVFLDVASSKDVRVDCIVMRASKELCAHLNVVRKRSGGRYLSPIVFNTFWKQWEEPERGEGFTSIQDLHFQPHFVSETARTNFLLWS